MNFIEKREFTTSKYRYVFADSLEGELFYIVHMGAMLYVADYLDKPRKSKLDVIRERKKVLADEVKRVQSQNQ